MFCYRKLQNSAKRNSKQCFDGISFAKEAAAVNATVSDIYTRLEGRQGKRREERGGEIVFELKEKLLEF